MIFWYCFVLVFITFCFWYDEDEGFLYLEDYLTCGFIGGLLALIVSVLAYLVLYVCIAVPADDVVKSTQTYNYHSGVMVHDESNESKYLFTYYDDNNTLQNIGMTKSNTVITQSDEKTYKIITMSKPKWIENMFGAFWCEVLHYEVNLDQNQIVQLAMSGG